MIRSMTGFGDASAQADGVHYFVEVRSLNNKYFKGVIRLPDEFQALEAELEARLRERVQRGTVTLTCNCTDESASAAYEINTRALDKYIAQLNGLAGVKDGSLKLEIGALLALPGVLQPPGNEEDRHHKARKQFTMLMDKAMEQLLAMREREGNALRKDLGDQRDLIASRLAQINGRAPEVIADYEKRLKTRIETMFREAEIKLEMGDLIREIAVYAERTDIAEEIKRLGGHIEQFGDLLNSNEPRPLGRTLDFLAQEMLREANTIASKSPDASVSRWAVEIKGAIDRIKEQAANVE